ncbi:hypothetical protein AB0L25_38410 [Spirillospora sp. NPDC052242]
MSAATINNRLAAVDAFFALRGSGRPAVVREHPAHPSVPRVICHLAYYAGLRVAEIVSWRWPTCACPRKGSVRVRGKGRLGGKDRTVPLRGQARASIEDLLDTLGRPTAGPLVRNRDSGAPTAYHA